MATQTTNSNPAIPKAVTRKLNKLRRKLTGWIFVHGIGRWLLVILAVLVFSMLIDRLFKMDYAQRLIMLCLMAAGAIGFFFWRVVRPLMGQVGDDALIFEVEDKNKELNQSLISGIQLARDKNLAATGASQALADATIRRGVEQAEKVDFSNALDGVSNQKNWMLLMGGLLLAALLGVGVSQTNFLGTWFNRNILLTNDQWPQSTYLEIVDAEDGRLRIPRGVDRRQLVRVTEESKVTDVDITLELDTPNGRTMHRMKPTGKLDGRERVFVFHNVSSEFRFRASGGDATTDWIQIELVEPPSITELNLEASLPTYTNVAPFPLVGSGPHSLLYGSQLKVRITSNKPLQSAVLKRPVGETPMSAVGDSKTEFALDIDRLSGGVFEFILTDETGLESTRRSKFEIALKEDLPPKVRASLLGISGMVVPRALLPLRYNAADEYGLSQLEFDCHWKTNEENAEMISQAYPFGNMQDENGKFILTANSDAALDLLDLNLKPETSFLFSIKATDNNPEKPGVGRSQEFLLRIVTEEKLRADLLRREIEQRQAFEQAYNAQLEMTAELRAIAAMRPEAIDDAAMARFNADREARLIGMTRDQKSIGTSLDRIAARFEEFLVEVKNNRLDQKENELEVGQRIEVRFDQGIIQPIRRLDAELISLATRNLDNCRRTSADQTQLAPAVDQTVAIQEKILEEMKKILSSMVDSENFQEIVNKVLSLTDDEEGLKKAILDKAKPKDIFDDNDKQDIFDK